MHTGIIELSWSSLMILANVIVLYFIMKHFFFEKIHNFMQARKDEVTDAIATAESVNRKADTKMENYDRKISKVEAESRDIVKAAKVKADTQAKNIIDEANGKANEMIVRAEHEIEREKIKALAEMKTQVTALALMAAAKIMEKEIAKGDEQNQIVNQIIEEAGKSGWQN